MFSVRTETGAEDLASSILLGFSPIIVAGLEEHPKRGRARLKHFL